MSIYLGNTEIAKIYLGNTEISEAYLGSTKVFDGGSTPPTPPTPPPYDAKIEYLQGNGGQYIDSLIYSNNTNEFEVDFEIVSGSNSTGLVSYRASQSANNATRAIWCKAGNIAFATKGTDSGWNAISNARHTAKTEGKTFYLDGSVLVTAAYNNTYTADGTIGIFRSKVANGWDSRTGATIKLYSLKIWDQSVLVRDFIPVRIEQDGYLYDNVSGTMFGNAGTGNFTLGNDINT